MALTGEGVQDGEELLHQVGQEGPFQLSPACMKGRGSASEGWGSVMDGWGNAIEGWGSVLEGGQCDGVVQCD